MKKRLVVCACACSAWTSIAAGQVVGFDRADPVREALGVTAFELVTLDLPETAGEPILTALDVAGGQWLLDMTPHSMRAADFRMLVDDASGMVRQVEAPPVRTYRGSIWGIEESVAAGSLDERGLTASVLVGDELWIVQPLGDAIDDAPRNVHVVYRAQDSIQPGHVCGNDFFDNPMLQGDPHAHDLETGPGDGGSAAIRTAEIAFDADYEFYVLNGSNVNNVGNDIEGVMNSVEAIYLRDVEINYTITTILVRIGEPDPYSSFNANTLLNQFRNEWNRNRRSIRRDVAHLMTGKNINGGTIGIAYIGVVCNSSYGYGLSESRFTSNWNYRVALTAHELGHNWNAPHCSSSCSSGSDCRIMCPCIGGCTGDVTRFGTASRNTIINFKNSRSCLN